MTHDKRVHWRQGLFLRPQHLQQQDLLHHAELEYRWRLCQPEGWGIRTLRLQGSSLADEVVEILELEALTRDGWLLRMGVEVSDGNCVIAARSFRGLFDPAKGPLSVYLAIDRKLYEEGQSNKSSSSDPVDGGFLVSRQPVRDVFNPALPEVEIEWVQRKAGLLFDQEPEFGRLGPAYNLMKISELVRTGEARAVSFSRAFIHPCLTVSSSFLLLSRLKELRDTLIAKADEFASLKRQRGVRAMATGVQESIRLQMMQTMSRQIPLLQHFIESGSSHPEPVYMLLRQFAGELSVFHDEFTALGAQFNGREWSKNLPAYDHENLWQVFDGAITRITQMVTRMTLGPQAGLRLEYDSEKKMFHARIPAALLQGENNRYYLVVDSPSNGEQLRAHLQETGKVTTKEEIDALAGRFLRGLTLQLLHSAPDELPMRGGGTLSFFMIVTEGSPWQAVRAKENIAVSCDLDPRDTTMQLFVVQPE